MLYYALIFLLVGAHTEPTLHTQPADGLLEGPTADTL